MCTDLKYLVYSFMWSVWSNSQNSFQFLVVPYDVHVAPLRPIYLSLFPDALFFFRCYISFSALTARNVLSNLQGGGGCCHRNKWDNSVTWVTTYYSASGHLILFLITVDRYTLKWLRGFRQSVCVDFFLITFIKRILFNSNCLMDWRLTDNINCNTEWLWL